MKRLLMALVVVEVILAALLVVPLLHERDSYGRARAMHRDERTDDSRETWDTEQVRRDRQVMLAFGAVVGLCLNSCVLCYVFGRVVSNEPRRPPHHGKLSRRAKRHKRLALLALAVAIALIAFGSVAFGEALRSPGKAGLRGLVAILAGGMLAFGAILAWALARQPDTSMPVDDPEREE